MTEAQFKTLKAVLMQNRQWILKKSSGDTSGWCVVSAIRVNHFLKKHGFTPELIMVWCDGMCHCFNHLKDRETYILDVTADQFYPDFPFVLKERDKVSEDDHYWFWAWDEDGGEGDSHFSTNRRKILNYAKDWGYQSPQEALRGIVKVKVN